MMFVTRSITAVLILASFTTNAQDDRTFTLRSPELGGHATERHVYNGFGCSGKNQSPSLVWENAPEEARSFAVTMYDPDAPTGSGWWHWVVYDIPAGTTEIPAGAGSEEEDGLPEGAIQARTDFGGRSYGGPCPPEGHGPHRYILTVHAMDTEKLEVPEDASPALIGFNLNDHTLAKASLIFYYER